MAKFLASKKGKASVKATADSALQAAIATQEGDSEQDLLDTLKTATKATDDWGADSDSEPVGGDNPIIGGYFHLISEEDVSKKQQRKPRKWGEVIQDKEIDETSVTVEQPEAKPVEPPVESKMTLYKAGMRRQRRTQQQKPVDVQNPESFPGLSDLGIMPTSSGSGISVKKKEKKIEEKPVESKIDEKNQEEKSQLRTIQNEESNKPDGVMLIKQFLHDIPNPKVNVVFSDDASRAKFVGRKKRPYVSLPEGEL